MLQLSCDKCQRNCTSYNNGSTFAVHDKSGCIWLESGEHAPCGVVLGKSGVKDKDDNFDPDNWA